MQQQQSAAGVVKVKAKAVLHHHHHHHPRYLIYVCIFSCICYSYQSLAFTSIASSPYNGAVATSSLSSPSSRSVSQGIYTRKFRISLDNSGGFATDASTSSSMFLKGLRQRHLSSSSTPIVATSSTATAAAATIARTRRLQLTLHAAAINFYDDSNGARSRRVVSAAAGDGRRTNYDKRRRKRQGLGENTSTITMPATAVGELSATAKKVEPSMDDLSEDELEVIVRLDPIASGMIYSEVGLKPVVTELEEAARRAEARSMLEEEETRQLESTVTNLRQKSTLSSSSPSSSTTTTATITKTTSATRYPQSLSKGAGQGGSGTTTNVLKSSSTSSKSSSSGGGGGGGGGGDGGAARSSRANADMNDEIMDGTGEDESSSSSSGGFRFPVPPGLPDLSKLPLPPCPLGGGGASSKKGNTGWEDTDDDYSYDTSSSSSSSSSKIPLPFFNVAKLGLVGDWEEIGGNYLLRPPPEVGEPKAVIHFLGGAFVGAAPHLTYNYLLSGLVEAGFIVVTTPYALGFDYLKVCDGVLEKFEKVAVPLAQQYGAIPVIGMGHSCGALLQLLICCLFPDTPRAANALISFNNKPVQEAVPLFDELVLPLANGLVGDNGELGSSNSALWDALGILRTSAQTAADAFAASAFAPAVVENELLPIFKQSLNMVDQVPPLLKELADGTREFTPSPEETKEVVRKMYRARRTLLMKFGNDSIDESEDIKEVIQEGKTLLRMRRPMVDMDLRLEKVEGTHITPLTQNIFLDTPLDKMDPLYGVRKSVRADFLRTVNELGLLLVEWLEEGLSPTEYLPR